MTTSKWGPQPLDPRHKLAFDVLDDFFRRHQDDVVEIEVLPPAIAPPDGSLILEDGLCIGVPKKVLAAAFVVACSVFFEKRVEADKDSVQRALDATRIILLFDPEHLMAANFRRLQLHSLPLFCLDQNMEDARPVHLELNFLDSILTSPLHRQSKSPTLWNYRAWIMGSFDPWYWMSRSMPQDVARTSLSDNFIREWGIILKSAERHPKNYYAWQYARRLVAGQSDHAGHFYARKERYAELSPNYDIVDLSADMVHDWCIRNPSDTSAWSFYYFLLSCFDAKKDTLGEFVYQSIERAHSFRWKHESFWVFLRTVIADSKLTSQTERTKYLQEIEDKFGTNGGLSSGPDSDAKAPHLAEDAVKWIRRNAPP